MKNQKRVGFVAAATGAALVGGVVSAKEFVIPAEMQQKGQWAEEHLLNSQASQLPFSFVYGEQTSEQLLANWPKQTGQKKLDRTRTQHTLTWTDAKSGLEVRCVAVDYADYPAIEWTVFFKNTGAESTPILKAIHGIDTAFQRNADGEFVLHGNKGDWNVAESYEPYQLSLGPRVIRRFASTGGRPTNGANGWPYYNIQMPGGGLLLAIGWPGQWASSFTRDDKTGLRIVAGQELTELSLKPGEEIRTPLIALVFWQGNDVVRSQNLWRRWFMAHNIPKINDQPPAPMAQMQLCRNFHDNAAVMPVEADKFAKAGIAIDIYWRDAGWYPCADGKWESTGTWEVDPKRFPKGFRPIADWIHANGKKLIVWFEPERVGDKNSWLATNHPDWLLSGTLLNLGNPAASKWVIEQIDHFIQENGIDYYRQDFNMDPLKNWRDNDTAGRLGITENLYVQGYLAFWDELRRRHHDMLIDSCASGGRRNDLETMRRAVPLLRSDFQWPGSKGVVEGNQGHTYGLSSWLPYYGSGVYSIEKYPARSFYMPGFGVVPPADWEKNDAQRNAVRQAYAECRQIASLMLADYYPLTPYSLGLDQWIGWQFDRPETGTGVVQVFRRDKCADTAKVLHLCGLNPTAKYELTDFDAGQIGTHTGNELMETGLTVTINDKPGAAIIAYKRVK